MEKVKKISKGIVFPKINTGELKIKSVACVIAFLISRIEILGGISPFSLPFLMAFRGSIPVFISSVLGILSTPSLNSVKQVLILFSAVLLSLLLKTAFPKSKPEKTAPFAAFSSTLIFSLVFVLFTDFTPFDVILCVLEAFVSMVFCCIFSVAVGVISKSQNKKFFTDGEIASVLVAFGLCLSGVSGIIFPYDLRLSNLMGIYIIMLTARNSTPAFTAQTAVFTGLFAGLSSENTGAFVAAYSLCGILSSVFRKYGKTASVLAFVLGNTVVGIFTAFEGELAISFTELAVAGICAVLTPDKHIGKLFFRLINSSSEYDKANIVKEISSAKLSRLSEAFRNLSETVSAEGDKEREAGNAFAAVFDGATDKYCRYCFLRGGCWTTEREKTSEIFLSAVKKIHETGEASTDDLPSEFTKKCDKCEKILNNLKNHYEIYRINEAWRNKIYERADIFRAHFYDLGVIIDKLRDEITENPYFDTALTVEVASELSARGIEVKDLSVIRDGEDNMKIDLTLNSCKGAKPCTRLISDALYDYFSVPFEKIDGVCGSGECRLSFKECEIYRLKTAVKQLSKNQGERCGDAYTIRSLGGGEHFVALCDGSGSGNNAFFHARKTIRLLEDFLKTGFSKRSVINLVNASLLLGPDSDYFSTVDLFVVNLKNLDAQFVKKGAAATYIFRENGEYEVINGNSLPMGISNKGREQVRRMKLKPDDVIVMASDGVVDAVDKEDWIVDAVHAAGNVDSDSLAELILKIAQSAAGDMADDMTVMTMRVV